MRDKREHTRFDLSRIQGTMVLVNKVQIVDISLGGIGLKTDKQLIIGREYTVKLSNEERSIDVNGTIVRSEIFRMEAGADGKGILMYISGMRFNEGSGHKIKDFLSSIEHHEKEGESPMVERRLHIRFQIIAPHETVLVFPVNFRVKDMSLSSMLILSDEPLEREDMVPIKLYLHENKKLDFVGRVFSCRKVKYNELSCFEIEITYPALKGKERETLKEFIAYLISYRTDEKEDWG